MSPSSPAPRPEASRVPAPEEPGENGRERALALLLLLPAAALAWPGQSAVVPGAGDAVLGGTALSALLLLPAAAMLALGGALPRIRGLPLLAAPLAAALLALGLGRVTDTLEANRMLLVAGVAATTLLGGASLGEGGRRILGRGFVLLSILWTLRALGGHYLAGEPQPTGNLENTGVLSQAALPGAAVGVWLALSRRGLWRVLGGLAFAAFLAHAALTPVYAGALGLALALTATAVGSPWAARFARVRQVFGGLAALVVFCAIGARPGSAGDEDGAPTPPQATPAEIPGTGDAGGFEVRLRVWGRMPWLVAHHALLGVGPGQFHAAFPPYRDPAEIELSTLSRELRDVPEVQHAHSDWLEGLAQFGLIGGVCWILFLAAGARAALRAVSSSEVRAAGLGTATLALLTNSLVHEPLLANPAAATLGFLLLGQMLAREPRAPVGPAAGGARAAWRAWLRRLAPGSPIVLLLLGALPAWSILAHHRALSTALERGETGDPDGLAHALDAALEARPDSVLALSLAASRSQGGPAGDREAIGYLDRALGQRPHSIGLLNNGARLLARIRRLGEARTLWMRALALDPANPLLLSNLARVELELDLVEESLGRLEALRAAGRLPAGLPRHLGAEEIRRGSMEQAVAVWAWLDPDLAPPEPYALIERAAAAREEGDALYADGLEALAHWLWGREHVELESPRQAVISLRQAYQRASAGPEVPLSLGLELAAAQALAGQTDAARRTLEGLAHGPSDREGLPEWAREALSGLDAAAQ